MKLARGYLILNGIILGAYGLYCLFNPMILNQYTGMGLTDPTALTEVRAMYGGLQFTVGLFFLWGGLQVQRVSQSLLVSAFIFAGLAGARAIGLAIDGGDNGYNFGAVIYEAASFIISVGLLQWLNRQK